MFMSNALQVCGGKNLLNRKSEQFHFAEESRGCGRQESLAARFVHLGMGVFGQIISHAAFYHNYVEQLQIIVCLEYGVGVYTHQCREFSHRGYAFALGPLAAQYLGKRVVYNLLIYRFFCVKIQYI